ncbi:DUF4430 domain-containing protein [Bacillus sp. BGMRC 2118]|nr:DUF4430 domain-containing protein [Bacillus sp. BGMRC 2118]
MRNHIRLLTIILFTILIAVISGCNNNQEETKDASPKENTIEVKENEEISEQDKKDTATPVESNTSEDSNEPSEESTQTSESNTTKQNTNTTKTNQDSTKPANNSSAKTSSEKKAVTSSPAAQTPKVEEKKEEKPVTPPVEKQPENLLSVSTVIKGPSNVGTIVGKTAVEVKEGATILDILLLVAKNKGITVDYSGKGSLAYVEGIHNIYEFDYGQKSGWTCRLNGVTLDRSADAIQVKNGDHIEWIYKEDYTEE